MWCLWMLLVAMSTSRPGVVPALSLSIPPPSRRRRGWSSRTGPRFLETVPVEPTASFPAASPPPPPPQPPVAVLLSSFWEAYRLGNVADLLACCEATTIVWDDYECGSAYIGAIALERHWRLDRIAEGDHLPSRKDSILQTVLTDDTDPSKIGFTFVEADGIRGCALVTLNATNNRIERVEMVREPKVKGGESNLQLLKQVSALFPPRASSQGKSPTTVRTPSTDRTVAEQYFDAWNRRNMTEASALFTEDVLYDDTAFPNPISGKERLQQHLELCATVFPPSFAFVVDRTVVDSVQNCQMVLWHVENDGSPLPYTRGCSIYYLDDLNCKIRSGVDWVEPNGPFKPRGTVRSFVRSMQIQFSNEPVRWIPTFAWLTYLYVVFFSDGILPGANALALEPRTWQEVTNLSLNFFLVAPLLQLTFSPSVHPMLEGVFNALLAWAALFAGFLSDDRPAKPNWIPLLPTVVGMQFLTSAFFLPYLATRTSEEPLLSKQLPKPVSRRDVSPATRWVGENRWWGPMLGGVSAGSIVWAVFGRADEAGVYGATLSDRWDSFGNLLSIDRVGCSFLVDLAIFAVLQGWLIDDDWKRRRRDDSDGAWLPAVGKYVPLFGLAAYLTLRPPLPEE